MRFQYSTRFLFVLSTLVLLLVIAALQKWQLDQLSDELQQANTRMQTQRKMLAISERQLQLLDEAPFLTEQWYVDPVATKRQLANKRREILELNREKQLLELLAGD